MIEPHLLAVLRIIYDRLKNKELRWMIVGSMNLALQGMPLKPKDIDISTNEQGAYAIEKHFGEFVVKSVCYSSTDKIRSHIGELNIAGIKVEIMGDTETKSTDGRWIGKEFADQPIIINVEDMKMPVSPLEHEHQDYLNLGRVERARQIEEWLEKQAKSNDQRGI
ncbi:MAG: nucleotidyltransferase domain-containing protein [Candidatus Hodarchaeales archaeon]